MDPKVLFWIGAWLDLAATAACAWIGVRCIQRREWRAHRRWMLSAVALVGLFLLAYAIKLAVLGGEDRGAWTPLDHALLYVHELGIAGMLLGGACAGVMARRFVGRLGPGPVLEPEASNDPSRRTHRRAGRVAVASALLALVLATGVLARMLVRVEG